MIWTYVIIAVMLLAFELIYFKIADKCLWIELLEVFNQLLDRKHVLYGEFALIDSIVFVIFHHCRTSSEHSLYHARREYA